MRRVAARVFLLFLLLCGRAGCERLGGRSQRSRAIGEPASGAERSEARSGAGGKPRGPRRAESDRVRNVQRPTKGTPGARCVRRVVFPGASPVPVACWAALRSCIARVSIVRSCPGGPAGAPIGRRGGGAAGRSSGVRGVGPALRKAAKGAAESVLSDLQPAGDSAGISSGRPGPGRALGAGFAGGSPRPPPGARGAPWSPGSTSDSVVWGEAQIRGPDEW